MMRDIVMNVRYRVDLSQIERDELRALVSGGKQPVRRLKRMQILLAADAGVSDEAIEASVQTSGSTIYPTRKRFVEISLEAALSEEPRPGAARKSTPIGHGARSRSQIGAPTRTSPSACTTSSTSIIPTPTGSVS